MSMSPPSSPASTSTPEFAPHVTLTFSHGEREERIVVAGANAGAAAGLEISAANWLSAGEQARIAKAVAKRRREFLLGRYAAKTALAVWNRRASLAEFALEPGVFEQPVVAGESAADATLAHSGDAAVAIAHERGHPVGVDLETVDADRIDVLRTQVSAAELPSPHAAAATEAERLFLLWSAKEALSKALRCGLTCPFELLAATQARFDAAGICTGTFANFGQYRFAAWLIGNRTFALACSRNARLEPILPGLMQFTREATEARP
jgi:4'-phosphopantetheinyl transferase